MENLDKMFRLGIYITDLSMHDVSRDLVLVGTQQSQELTQAFDQVQKIMLQTDSEKETRFFGERQPIFIRDRDASSLIETWENLGSCLKSRSG